MHYSKQTLTIENIPVETLFICHVLSRFGTSGVKVQEDRHAPKLELCRDAIYLSLLLHKDSSCLASLNVTLLPSHHKLSLHPQWPIGKSNKQSQQFLGKSSSMEFSKRKTATTKMTFLYFAAFHISITNGCH